MRHLKSFENILDIFKNFENQNRTIEKVFNEIDHLKYILEDENIQFHVNIMKPANNPNWICIHLETKHRHIAPHSGQSLVKTKYDPKNDLFIQEYLDRVREICEENGYKK